MKCHYQYVSATTVRIELIAEDQHESTKLASLGTKEIPDTELEHYFKNGVSEYAKGVQTTQIRYMQFPIVALCRFEKITETIAHSLQSI